MSASTLKSLILTDLQTNLKPRFDATANSDNVADLSTMDFDTLWGIICNAIATHVVAHITAAAKATGTDSGGDTHNLDIA